MADLNKITEDLSSLSVKDMVALISDLEKKWNVSAAVQVAAAPVAEAAAVQEKTEFDVELTSIEDGKKLGVIKALRVVISGLGLTEAKALVEGAPKIVKEAISKEEAEKIKKELEAAGGKVALK
ncbi:50S ribosomal protein L7/L12 [Candidatus Cyrtobacter comes]|uniref:Large ribosomal subunit protein bL12 n=1 Tax=Candidatus Cyrtobacter comes TaxID=675776 RepID=A0ABU5L7I3_9RICK|nr:50S ribosomal protein L7/L12 [Candidatus Cyrtobacter comes]MDZ5761830.1 50S ribosomal protein L7/L12 [Candidatus Cyrtobacter comes]